MTALVLVIYLVRPEAVNSHDSQGPDVLASFLTLPQQGFPLVVVGWTLVYEMYFYLVFTFALRFNRRWFPCIIGGWTAVTIVLHLSVADTSDPFLGFASSLLGLEFVFGIAVGYLVMNRRMVAPRALLLAASSAILVLLAYAASRNGGDFPWVRVFTLGLAVAVVVYASIGMEVRRGARVPRFIERLGDASYSLYLWHVLVLSGLGLLITRIVPQGIVAHVLALVAAVGITVVAGLWLYEALERPLLRVFHTRDFSLDFRLLGLGAGLGQFWRRQPSPSEHSQTPGACPEGVDANDEADNDEAVAEAKATPMRGC